MEPVTNKLRRTRLFAHLSDEGIAELISQPGVQRGGTLDQVHAQPGDLVVLLEGGLHMTAKDGKGDHLAILSVNDGSPEPAILYTIPPGANLKLTRDSVYVVVAGEHFDDLQWRSQAHQSLAALDDGVRERVAALITAAPFKRLTFERVVRCAEAMDALPLGAGDNVVVEGEPGDYFYVLQNGAAEVVRSGASGGLPVPLALLQPGATFGEEALLQDSPRNATVRMRTPGRVLRLARADFDRLLRTELAREIDPAAAKRLLDRNAAEVIDCRTEEEWELWRLPRARLIPLETVRDRARGLDPSRTYLLYCRSGRRAGAAAFLMRQMGLEALAIEGGIAAWPYEFEGLPLDT